MGAEDATFDIATIFLSEVAELRAAREKCRVLHASKNIDAAGDEVEIAVRDLLRRKLGSNYYVGHGHIIDQNLQVSPQLDVIIADASVIPSIFRETLNKSAPSC